VREEMDVSTKECPECGYDYMEFYESQSYIRYICPDCGYTEEVDKKEEKK
jgi:ribosomal protein S27AE